MASSRHNPYFDAAQSLQRGDASAAAAAAAAAAPSPDPSPSQLAASSGQDEGAAGPPGARAPPPSTSTPRAPGAGPRVTIDENPTINIITPGNVWLSPIPSSRRRSSASRPGFSTQSSISINRLRAPPSPSDGADLGPIALPDLPARTHQGLLSTGAMPDPLPTVAERNSTCLQPEALEVDATDFSSRAAADQDGLPSPTASGNRPRCRSDISIRLLRSRFPFPSSQPGASDQQRAPGTPRTPCRTSRTIATPVSLYGADVLDLLDVVDPEVQTLNTLNNVQNSLFVPDLGHWINRRPTYNLSPVPAPPSTQPAGPGLGGLSDIPEDRVRRQPPRPLHKRLARLLTRKMGDHGDDDRDHDEQELPRPATGPGGGRPAERPVELPVQPKPTPLSEGQLLPDQVSNERASQRARVTSIASQLSDSHYAVLPHGVSLDDWSNEDKEALDDYVRHMLHSKRSKFHQTKRAFCKYVSKPLGFFVTLYATLITLFGLAWVLFLIGWIYVGKKQPYATNVIDNVLVALFAIVGDGLAPFRAVDTYHMLFIARYHNLTKRLRKKRALPKLRDENELPRKSVDIRDVEEARSAALGGRPNSEPASIDDYNNADEDETEELSVLNEEEQRKLLYHQTKYTKSHSFYKPHQTETHHAFPHHLLVAITLLLDCHSLFQIALGTYTWSTNYQHRRKALTAIILICSIACNITAGVLITIGDHRTRKKHIIEQMRRQGMTHHAMKKLIKRKEDERREREEREARRSSGTYQASRTSGAFERIAGAFGRSTESAASEKTMSGAGAGLGGDGGDGGDKNNEA